MSTLFKLPKAVAVNSAGTPHASAQANFYLTGTTTATNTYTDAALTTPHANPVIASSAGVFEAIYLDPAITYKLTLNDSALSLLYTVDPINDDLILFGNTILTKTTSYTVTVADQGAFIFASGASTITLPTVASAGAGFQLVIINSDSTNSITVDGDSAETINSVTSITLAPNESLMITCNASIWVGVVTRSAPNITEAITGAETVALRDRGRVYTIASGTFTITLLAAATAKIGFNFSVINTGTGTVTLDGNAAETINGSATVALPPGSSVTVICDGTNWALRGSVQATTTIRGEVELLTTAETRTGSDTTRAMTAVGLANTIFAAEFNGDSTPSLLQSNPGASGWTIAETVNGQYKITHGLGLASPFDQLQVVSVVLGATEKNCTIGTFATNDFTVFIFNTANAAVTGNFRVVGEMTE